MEKHTKLGSMMGFGLFILAFCLIKYVFDAPSWAALMYATMFQLHFDL